MDITLGPELYAQGTPGCYLGKTCSADLTESIRSGYESANEERVGAKDKKGMWPTSFHNNPCSKLLFLLPVISNWDAGVSCSISPSVQQEAQGKSKMSAREVEARGEPRCTRVTVTPSITGTSLWLGAEEKRSCWAGGGGDP